MALSDEIKERLDIVDVVSGYLPNLRKSGRNFTATCPFHTERTPSFVVFPDRGSWRCFGACATGGDVLSFVLRMEKLSFSETLKLLARRVGLPLRERKDNPQRNALYRINDAAAAFFQGVLKSQQGIAARAYLQQRGLDQDTIRRFQIGLSPGAGQGLVEHLESLGYTLDQIVEAGLATRNDDLPPRDMFLSRLLFPIHDSQGNLVGFGGRSLDGSEPKYLNTPRTDVFDKGHILYAFHRAKKAIREQGEGVIVEGYMDAIAAHQYGFGNVVASMGTALTEHQVALLKGTAKRFVMALDADAAGQAATFRSLSESWQALKGRSDVSLRILLLPFGKDPDELIRMSPETWRRSIAEATLLLDYLFESAHDFWDLTTSQGKQQAAQELFPVIAAMENPFEQESCFRRLAQVLDVTVATLEASVGRPQVERRRVPSRSRAETAASASAFESQAHDALEEHMLAILLRWPELLLHVRELEVECFIQWDHRQIFTELLESNTIDRFVEDLDEDLRQRANYLLSLDIPPLDLRQREQAVMDCFHRLQERRLRSLKLEEESLLAQTGGDETRPHDLADVSLQAIEINERLRRLFYAKLGR